MAVKFTSRINIVTVQIGTDLDKTVLNCVTDIDRTAKILAPKLTRALVKSGRITRKGTAHYSSSFNTPYATRRHYENRKNPQTLRYLEKAGDAAVKQFEKYVVKL